MPKKYNRSNCVYNINYHITWITKYRYSILNATIQDKLKEFIKYKCDELDVKIKAIEIMPNHIHIFISCKPFHNISKIVNYLKGYTSFNIRKAYPYLKKYKALWTNSYFCESIGFVSEKAIIKYIQNQKHIYFLIMRLFIL